ncbi:tetratricopeptide repeat protein [Runella sp. CRIBMP]|uniref:tetratricopeptide repeat protein n=1 Tax=Runella sp. CRIBMP TaxID=2683261 RepID=UPI00141236D5|nr:tetratricopeptide repeat protein [Runella sp. CRIBMP]NBB20510.1 tetratricopeptide repeat protein [Runella sp. CRIBMP]
MKRLLLSLFLTLMLNVGVAQRNQVDSLLKQLSIEKVDTNKIAMYAEIGYYYMDNNAGKAIEYFKNALVLSETLNKKYLVSDYNYTIGYCYLIKGDYNKSLEYLLKAARMYEDQKSVSELANTFMQIANVYGQLNDFKRVNEYQDKAQVLVEKLKDSEQLADLLDSRGILNDRMGQYGKALEYHQKAYKIALSLKDEDRATSILSNIGLNYKHQNKTKEALDCFYRVKNYFEKNNPNPITLASLYNNIASTYVQNGSYSLAKASFDKSISISAEAGIPYIVMENYHNLSVMYGKMKDFEPQIDYLNKYYAIKDSLFTVDSKNQLTQLEADYQVEQKNIEIIKQAGEVVNQKNQRNIFVIISISAALLLSAMVIFYLRINKANQLLNEKNNLINTQKNELEVALHNLYLTQEELIRQEKFASVGQLTKGIVDRILNPLNYINNFSESSISLTHELKEILEKEITGVEQETKAESIDLLNLIENSMVKINDHGKSTARIVKDMQSLLKEKSSDYVKVNLNETVVKCVNDVYQKFKNANQQFKAELIFHLENQEIIAEVLPLEFSQAISNIIDNSLYILDEKYKTVKYFVPEIKISTKLNENDLFLKIRDNGKGIPPRDLERLFNPFFTTKPTSAGTGLGLFMSKDIIEIHKGKINITSKEGEFTEVVIVLPIVNEKV